MRKLKEQPIIAPAEILGTPGVSRTHQRDPKEQRPVLRCEVVVVIRRYSGEDLGVLCCHGLALTALGPVADEFRSLALIR